MMKSKNIAISALFITFMTIGAFVKIPGPLLPMTLQTFFAVFGALLLKGKHILVSMSLYILIGLIGVPVFSEGGGIAFPNHLFKQLYKGYPLGGGGLKETCVFKHRSVKAAAKIRPRGRYLFKVGPVYP